ncbi:hypothetical protein Nepgr_023983 [Nepenthes gracilis]|uniref:Uncharacterized protein n=1 Tax=Nepenthes gracilis TaxID=150966 RepID=A0AAD3XZL7_NEPGR|nr:hypothetical protein Nepgr_023983 [Nepenthes gracilis]
MVSLTAGLWLFDFAALDVFGLFWNFMSLRAASMVCPGCVWMVAAVALSDDTRVLDGRDADAASFSLSLLNSDSHGSTMRLLNAALAANCR